MSAPGRFLARWSRLKREEVESGALPKPQVASAQVAQLSDGMAPTDDPPPTVELPSIESLDLSSDFTAFLKEEVSESLRRAALKKLFGDPVFNAMDGLDIYIDDYSIPDPIAPGVMQRLKQFETFLAEPVESPETDRKRDAQHSQARVGGGQEQDASCAPAPGPGVDTGSVEEPEGAKSAEIFDKHQ